MITTAENHVVSLEMAKKLKEAGWKKNTEFLWKRHSLSGNFTDPREYEYKIMHLEGFSISKNDNIYPAPLATEILEELLCYTKIIIESKGDFGILYQVSYATGPNIEQIHYETESILSDALAKMWLFLKKEGLI